MLTPVAEVLEDREARQVLIVPVVAASLRMQWPSLLQPLPAVLTNRSESTNLHLNSGRDECCFATLLQC